MNGDVLFEYIGKFSDAFNRYKEYRQCLVVDPGTVYYENFQSDFSLPPEAIEYHKPHFCVDLSNFNVEICGEGLDGFDGAMEDYHGSSFRASCLYWASFADSNLENVDFACCDLRGATFDHANLRNANFDHADLGYANIGKGATLFGADLTGANLNDADLDGACYDSNTIFPHDFVIPNGMMMKQDDESDDDFFARCMAAKCTITVSTKKNI